MARPRKNFICTANGCEEMSRSLGLCVSHYRKLRRYGNPDFVPPQGMDLFWSKVNKTNTCWLWTGATQQGYGVLTADNQRWRAHRFLYELVNGPIPPGLHLDHLCRTRNCVRPEHLEPVTASENNKRMLIALGYPHSVCKNGHPWDDSNTYQHRRGYRVCRRCNADRMARKKRAA